MNAERRCSVCAKFRHECQSKARYSGHTFQPDMGRPQIDTKATVAALKGFIKPTAAPPEPKPLPEETA